MTTQKKATFTTVKDKVEKPADAYKDANQKKKPQAPTTQMIRLNRALQNQRRAGKSAQQHDISQRAKREQFFKDSLRQNYNINVR